MSPVLQIDLPGIPKMKSGKVREIFDLGECFLLVATDRISAFDCILPNGIPRKGEVLTQLSHFWFDQTCPIISNHRINGPDEPLPERLLPYSSMLDRRSMLVIKAEPLPVECVVRGYLAGSGWKEYREGQSVCGIKLPPGLLEASELPEPIFTPAIKASEGHDQNIGFSQAVRMIGLELAERVREISLQLYGFARDHARQGGIIIADTKFEFGMAGGELILIDEALTPDSSRFWPADAYCPGRNQPSFDKQYVRDYLEQLEWDKRPPAPKLPDEVARKTSEKYLEAYQRLTGRKLAP